MNVYSFTFSVPDVFFVGYLSTGLILPVNNNNNNNNNNNILCNYGNCFMNLFT